MEKNKLEKKINKNILNIAGMIVHYSSSISETVTIVQTNKYF